MRPVMLERMSTEPPPPSQVIHPWRAVLRTTLTALIAFLPLIPQIADAINIDEIPEVAKFLAITIAVQRVLTLPGVENWLKQYAPWLAAEGYTYHGNHRAEDRQNED